jgi:hypothetical protein
LGDQPLLAEIASHLVAEALHPHHRKVRVHTRQRAAHLFRRKPGARVHQHYDVMQEVGARLTCVVGGWSKPCGLRFGQEVKWERRFARRTWDKTGVRRYTDNLVLGGGPDFGITEVLSDGIFVLKEHVCKGFVDDGHMR